MNTERRSLGFLRAEFVSRPDWLSTRIPETYLELSTCFGHVNPDELPLWTTPQSNHDDRDVKARLIEFGISSKSVKSFQSEEDLSHIPLLDAPEGKVLGYAVIGFECKGYGWHTQHCHNAADSGEGRSIAFNAFALIEKREESVRLADWYMQDESHVEPVFWLPVSVHDVAFQ